MAYFRSLALCLRVVDYGETSQIAAFFSRERGRMSAIAKGAKRRGSRFSGVLEPLALCELVCFRGREGGSSLATLAELDVLDTFRGAREGLARLKAAAYVIEVLREVAPEEQPLPEVFDLALDALRQIAGRSRGPTAPDARSSSEPDIRLAVVAFEARLLELLGLFPRLDACVECGGSLAASRPAFSARLGGGLCPGCRATRDRGAREVSLGTLEVLSLLGRHPERAAHLKIPAGQLLELRGILDASFAATLDRELRLAKYLQ
jgi:DNA repair protein RecO (recombination protein O)